MGYGCGAWVCSCVLAQAHTLEFDPLLGMDEDYLLERESRLSRSVLWTLQRRFFEQNPRGFADGTLPTYATTNAFIARSYAQLIHSFALDCDAQGPVTIIELGAGHGRFGFLCLTLLRERLKRLGKSLPIRYVMTDFTPHSLDAWSEHPHLAAMLADGSLDMACFDVEQDAGLSLRLSQTRINAQQPCGALVVIANYVFDGLIQDAYRIRGGLLEEGRVSLVADAPWPKLASPGLLATLSSIFTFSPLSDEGVYPEDDLNKILKFYMDNLGDGSFCLPTGAVGCLRRLQELSTLPVLVLSSDKANNHLHQVQEQGAPMVSTHGSISMMTNHHAIGRYVTGGGGEVLMTSPRAGELETAAFMLGGLAGERLSAAFDDVIERFSPADFLALSQFDNPDSLIACLKLLRLAAWDPQWLCKLIPVLTAGLQAASSSQRAELLSGVMAASALVFPIGDADRSGPIDAFREVVATSPR